MLKFIRKYQLIILAVGGSLLMVVFLFQPIIGKLSPDPRKATVATLADGTKFNGFDYQRASFDLAVIKRISPLLLLPSQQGGLGIEQGNGDEAELHWLLLSKMANDAGLVGDAGEGITWIPELARRNAGFQLQQQAQQGLIQFNSEQEFAQAVAQLAPQYEAPLQRNVALATGMSQGATEDDVYRTLATARGIERFYRVYSSVPSYSDIGAMDAAKQRYDAIAVDAVVIKRSPIRAMKNSRRSSMNTKRTLQRTTTTRSGTPNPHASKSVGSCSTRKRSHRASSSIASSSTRSGAPITSSQLNNNATQVISRESV
jgi:hypothetical protein